MEFLRAFRADEQPAGDGAGEPIRFVAATPGVKRDGLDLAALPWRVENYAQNPVVLLAHDYSGLPIGRATVTVVDDATERGSGKAPEILLADIVFDQEDEAARAIESKYRRGFLNAVSVGWDDVDDSGTPARASGQDAVAHELLDISAVAVPGDPAALVLRQRQAAQSLLETLTAPVEAEPEPEPTPEDWPDVGRAMVGVMTADNWADDDAREKAWRALLPGYRGAGRAWPEFLPLAELRALGAQEWRGLFLEGEADDMTEDEINKRVGAVLSGRNRDKLAQARDLISEVLKSATKADESADDAGDDDTERDAAADFLRALLDDDEDDNG